MDIAQRLRSEHGLTDYAAELEGVATTLVDAVIFELSDRERTIADLREELERERRRRPASEPHWFALNEIATAPESPAAIGNTLEDEATGPDPRAPDHAGAPSHR